MNTLVLKARNLNNFELSLVHAYINQRLYFKTVTINFHTIETVLPEGVVAIAQIAETRPEEEIDQFTQPKVTGSAQERNIVAAATFREA